MPFVIAEVCKLNDHEGAGAVGKKIAIDQLLYAPVLTCVLYAFLCAAHLDFDGIPIAIQVRNSTRVCFSYGWPAPIEGTIQRA